MIKCAFEYKYDGVGFKTFQVEERYIDFLKLKRNLYEEMNEFGVNVCLNQEVINIDTAKGTIEFNNCKKGQYDFIVNCSYINPFIGFSEIKLPLKYEFCTLLLISSNKIKNQAITVMDGEYVSIYPWLSNLHTVSSVKFTPSIKSSNLADLQQKIKNKNTNEIDNTNVSIEDHMKSF